MDNQDLKVLYTLLFTIHARARYDPVRVKYFYSQGISVEKSCVLHSLPFERPEC